MNDDLLNRPYRFGSWRDYEKHLSRLRCESRFKEVPVGLPYDHVWGSIEYWFEDTRTGAVWRLVQPDAPFRGVWEKIPSQ